MSRRKLLLADDSITIQKVVNLTFADEGIDVVAVGDGEAALAQLSSDTPDIVLADVIMPGTTGYEICERLRANEATRNLPVILLVGSFEPFDEAEASRVGANAYLTKPFQSIRQLVDQVNGLIDAARPVETESVPPVAASDSAEFVSIAPVAAALVSTESAVPDEPKLDESSEAEQVRARHFDDLGYETASPESETAPPVVLPPTADDEIDSLYTQSMSRGPEDDLSDVGVDDEIIETSYSTPESHDELEEFVPAPITEAAQASVEETSGSDAVQVAASEADTGFRSGYDQRFPEDPSKFENTIAYENWQPADSLPDESPVSAENAAETGDPLSLDTTPLTPPGPQPVEAVPDTSTVPDDTIRMENRFDTTGSSSFKFDDVDILDLSGEAEDPVELTSPVNALEQGSTKQVVTLSPELIEMIAQRVVEKLSEKY